MPLRWKSYGKSRKEAKKTDAKIKQRRLRAITLQGAIEKSQILLLQYWKYEQLYNAPKNVLSHFWCSNIIFGGCITMLVGELQLNLGTIIILFYVV